MTFDTSWHQHRINERQREIMKSGTLSALWVTCLRFDFRFMFFSFRNWPTFCQALQNAQKKTSIVAFATKVYAHFVRSFFLWSYDWNWNKLCVLRTSLRTAVRATSKFNWIFDEVKVKTRWGNRELFLPCFLFYFSWYHLSLQSSLSTSRKQLNYSAFSANLIKRSKCVRLYTYLVVLVPLVSRLLNI